MTTTGKINKTACNKNSVEKSEKENVSSVVVERSDNNESKANVSVFTKTTNPKVILQSECMNSPGITQRLCGRKLLKFACLIVLGGIILMTFFLSLKTYNLVRELQLLMTN